MPPGVAGAGLAKAGLIFNSYGPTEATVVATVAEVRSGEAVTIGKPIPNYSCYVVDECAFSCFRAAKRASSSSAGQASRTGYLKRDSLTAEKFIEPLSRGWRGSEFCIAPATPLF